MLNKEEILAKILELDEKLTEPLNQIQKIIEGISTVNPENPAIDVELFVNLVTVAASMSVIDITENAIKMLVLSKEKKYLSEKHYEYLKEMLCFSMKVHFEQASNDVIPGLFNSYENNDWSMQTEAANKLKNIAPFIGDIMDENLANLKKTKELWEKK